MVDGIAIGRAVKWSRDPEPRVTAGSPEDEHARLALAVRRASRGVEQLVRLLRPVEAELFEPEILILAELAPLMLERVDRGASADEAVHEATSHTSSDLLLDARARLLDGLCHAPRSVEALLEGREGDRVLVIQSLTPSVVALLPPRVVGILAASDGKGQAGGEATSHAVILARGRGIPVAYALPEVVLGVADDDLILLDTTGSVASVWLSPGESTVADGRRRLDACLSGRAPEEAKVAVPLAHLGLEVHVNIGSLYEHFPASAEGIGLLRTELVFSGHASAPSEVEQFAALRLIAASVGNAPVIVRLFDAGGDKPLEWLKGPAGSPSARGVALLFTHPVILDTQLRAIVRAAEHVRVRVLLPLVTCAGDVERIRALCHGKVDVGAMVETPAAVEKIDEVAAAADFICIGTNDLFASMTGQDRADTQSLDASALRMIERVIAGAHARVRKVTVCGEMAGDPHGAQVLVGLGVDAISVATTRFARVKLALRDVTINACRAVARRALS